MRARAVLAGALVLIATDADAHAFAARYDLPLPLWHYLAGGAAAVAVSFLVAALVLKRGEPTAPTLRLVLPHPVVRLGQAVFGLIGGTAFALVLAAGFLGAQEDWDSNLLPVTVWVVWWVGIAFVSALIGGIWPLIDPWLAIARVFAFRAAPLRWPRGLGAWPAVVLFLAFAWTELAWTQNAVPAKLATLIAAYSLLTFAGMALFGIAAWRANADPFARFFALFAGFAPFAADGHALLVRPFGSGLRTRTLPSAATVGFVVVALATVSFDGIGETPFWDSVAGTLTGWLYRAGIVSAIGYTATDSLIKTLGLISTPLVFAAVYLVTCRLVGLISSEPTGRVARRFVLSLVPIAIAYHLAHYLSYLLIQGQAVWPLLSDPLDLGWDLFGTAGAGVDIGIVGMRTVWLFAVVAIVVGHVAAVTLAHGEALAGVANRRLAVASQIPMLVLMIAYTMLSLWILAQPIVET